MMATHRPPLLPLSKTLTPLSTPKTLNSLKPLNVLTLSETPKPFSPPKTLKTLKTSLNLSSRRRLPALVAAAAAPQDGGAEPLPPSALELAASPPPSPAAMAAMAELVLSAEEPAERLAEVLAGDPIVAAEAAAALVRHVDAKGRACLLSALFTSATASSEEHFAAADANSDGVLDRSEFANYVESQAIKYGLLASPLQPRQLLLLGFRAAIGNLGFGFVDNFVMIIAGDAIQSTIGGTLGLSPLMSAGLGNAVADIVGTNFREFIEGTSSHFMPDSRVSPIQLEMKEARWAETVGATVGVTAGCMLGLLPLLFIKQTPANDSSPPQGGEGGLTLSNAAPISVVGAEGGRGDGGEVAVAFRGGEEGEGERWVEMGEGGGGGESEAAFACTSMAFMPPTSHPEGLSTGYGFRSKGYIAVILVFSLGMGVRRVLGFMNRRESKKA